MIKTVTQIKEYSKSKNILICIDSDGCAFDTMEIKWKECFIPMLIKVFELQAIAKYVREEAERINLYASTRGVNRFVGLPILFEALAKREEVKQYGFELPAITPLIHWIEQTDKLSIASLQEELQRNKEPILEKIINWSNEVNKAIREIVYGVPPFPYAKEALKEISSYADIAVVSSANLAAIQTEWSEHELTQYVAILCGQEMGTKKECIKLLKALGYDFIMMIGDALGDLEAARFNEVSFYPIIAGRESESWKIFLWEIIDKVVSKAYEGPYEEELIKKFEKSLP